MVVGGRELIDTLWNVNLNENTKQMTELIELIDTLWNVNYASYTGASGTWARINRYIMECKFRLDCASLFPIIELIDTL